RPCGTATAPTVDRWARPSRTPQPVARPLLDHPTCVVGGGPRRLPWPPFPPSHGGYPPAASLTPSDGHVSPNPHLYPASAKDSRRSPAPTSRMGAAKWRVPHL